MSEQKSHSFRPPLYHRREGEPGGQGKKAPGTERSDRRAPEPAASEKQGWEAYRKWLTRVGAKPAADRTPADQSIYSWKGYQNWADKVREAWKVEES